MQKRLRLRRFWVVAMPLAITACGKPGTSERAFRSNGDVANVVQTAASAHDVPADLMLAIGDIEGGLRLGAHRAIDPDDDVPVAGVLELRHGAYNSLARGSALTGTSEPDLEADFARGTDAGARVLADLAGDAAIERNDMVAWAPVVEMLSGYRDPADRAEYRSRVFTRLKYGGTLKARDGETIVLSPHDEIPAGLTIAPPAAHTLNGPDYAPAIYFPTDCTNKCNTDRSGNAIEMIAIHDTEGGWDASVSTLQNDPGKSVHYIVDQDGSRVGQFVPESYTAWHVGNYYYNQRMVGIEHVGYSAQDAYGTPMYDTSAKLVKDICARNNIPCDRAHLIGHQEVPNGTLIAESSPPCTDSPGTCTTSPNYGGAGNHRDPGVNWNWCQYLEIIGGGGCKCNDAYSLYNCTLDHTEMWRCPSGQVEVQHCQYGCVSQPNGVDDQCAPPPGATTATVGAATVGAATSSHAATSSAATTGTGVTTGNTGASSSAAVTPLQSTSGAGGNGGTGGAGNRDKSIHGGCSCSTSGQDSSPYGLICVAAAVLAFSRRRNHV